ncbi:hypothetical protein O0I10_005615 [Lichtheimia ornata]|uniref:BHLH domain-containing protein n=1 Tax=Lichtheimia ornata TaxID=688661 RepID=A0AAD7V5D6_9FUNG|nr:uncharacterized protein O0I10_005615 [Lichtheimia ornata]KAJ8658575.1 hypothetical protein O0I10_005615 [Lichtheimia ornata]
MSQIILATNSPTTHVAAAAAAAASYRAEQHQQQAFHAYPGYGGYGAVPTATPLQYPPPVPIPYPMTTAARFPYYSEPPMSPHHHHRATPTVAPSSPDSVPASSSAASNKDISQTTSPNSVGAAGGGPLSTPHILPSQQPLAYRQHDQPQAALVTPLSPRFSNATTERVKETIARANSVPMEFYHTEFLEYSKETYEKKKQNACKRNKRKRSAAGTSEQSSTTTLEKKQKLDHISEEESTTGNDDDSVVEDEDGQLNTVEMRRQIHIQSEQKRRAQIRDGFDELRKHLPGCNNKKMSKAALLTRTVQQLHHLKSTQSELLEEVERLMQENENLKKFQHGILQRQAMEKMCAI